MHLAEMEAALAGMPVVCVRHDGSRGPAVKDIHIENFNISVGGRDLIVDGLVTLSFGRHYGEIFFSLLTPLVNYCVFFCCERRKKEFLIFFVL